MLDQRLRGLERRVSTIEGNLSELTELFGRMDLMVSKLAGKLKRQRRRGD